MPVPDEGEERIVLAGGASDGQALVVPELVPRLKVEQDTYAIVRDQRGQPTRDIRGRVM